LSPVSSFNIICTNNFTGNIINGTSLTVNSINSPTITTTTLTTNSIVATTLSASGNIITNSTLNANTIITTNFICLNNIGIGTTLARSTLHLNASANANSSILFTNLNDISIKIGYNTNDFKIHIRLDPYSYSNKNIQLVWIHIKLGNSIHISKNRLISYKDITFTINSNTLLQLKPSIGSYAI
jgi:hypothetical protein